MKPAVAIAAAAAVGAGAFVIGRVTATRSGARDTAVTSPRTTTSTTTPTGAESQPPTRAPSAAPPVSPAVADRAASSSDAGAAPADVAASCPDDLRAARDQLATAQDDRLAREGAPIPAPKDPLAPRFAGAAMSGAITKALAQVKVPGSVDGVDCSEYPCIVYGRINGTEDTMEPIEHAPSLRPYQSDISVILLWTEADEAAEDAAEARHQPFQTLEQMLYAITYYSRDDAAQRGGDLDRRIRWRAMDLWGANSPADETGASK